ncbi:MAG: response regulator [Defluviitaleaceae bacterium]|nr:response regulator [Defluviitaleaceae bacterium]MCL2274659.1 response regulator [Defluviitaleaceae bacterium]MCL2275780.1 response regulator [Defluviitaleaceae bacterium]
MAEVKKTLFLIDDDLTNLNIGSTALSPHYHVVTFNSGARLLKALQKKLPDLILLDIDMPEMDGFTTLKRVREIEAASKIPVIFLTAKTDSNSELEGLSLGAIDYIHKPFTPALLCKRIEVHLTVESQRIALVDFNANLQKMVDEKTKTVIELQNAIIKTMGELVDVRDNITGSHIERTQSYLRILVTEMRDRNVYAKEVGSWDLELVVQSAQLHDVGKIAIADSILHKPGRLLPDEFDKIKYHTTFGKQIISKIKENTTDKDFLEYAEILAYTHHEKWNGKGYPQGLSGEDIPLLGRIMAIADVYDALVSERPYKKPFTHEQAVEIIKKDSGWHFDPTLVELFLDVADQFDQFFKGVRA